MGSYLRGLTTVSLLLIGIHNVVSAAAVFPAWPNAPPPTQIPGSPYVVVQWFSTPVPIESTFDVLCNGVDIGDIRTQFGAGEFAFLDSSGNQVRSFGDYTRFGFEYNGANPCPPGERIAPGTQFRWIQTVYTNDPLAGQPKNQWFVDYERKPGKNDPFYSDQDQGRWGFTTAADDIPSRFRPTTVGTDWLAETALVCTYDDDHIGVIGSFLWQFSIPTSGQMTWFAPTFWGPPSDTFMATLRADRNAQRFDIDVGCCCQSVPEPSTFGLIILGSIALAAGRFTRRPGGTVED